MFGFGKRKARPCTLEDTEFFYTLCLGRGTRHEGEQDKGTRAVPYKLVRSLLSSKEFLRNFLDPILTGNRPVWKPYTHAQQQLLESGFNKHFGLKKVLPVSWHEAIEAALTAPRFLTMFDDAGNGVDCLWLRAQLETLPPTPGVPLIGRIEATQSHGCRGYVLNSADPAKPVTLDIFVNDSFVGQAEQSLLRRDLQEEYGGKGRYGFELDFTVPAHLAEEATLVLQAFDHFSGFLAFEPFQFAPVRARQRDTVSHLTRLLQQLVDGEKPSKDAAAILARIKQGIPSIERAAAIPLEQYSLNAPALDELKAPEEEAAPAVSFVEWGTDTEDHEGDLIVRTRDGETYAGAAAAWFAAAAKKAPKALVFYADYIVKNQQGTPSLPYFRAAFDPELLIADPDYSRCYAVRSAALKGREHLHDQALWLELLAEYGEEAFAHVPHLLAHLPEVAASLDQNAVQAYLLDTPEKATVAAHRDIYAPPLAGYGYVSRTPVNAAAKLAVIIPSRDNLNLLQPCVESLMETMAAPSATEIIIVDNGSTDKATLAWLKEQQDEGNIHVITSDTPFNWAGLNNHAAEHTDAEYLLFLNDDTKSVTQRWDERLRAQLERSDIGVVGARLFYEDGTLQHGGVVINSLSEVRPDAIVHDASGEAPDQGGYLNRSRLCHRVSAVTGAFLACRARDFKALDGFDAEQLGIAFNDIDFCLKVSASGKAVLYDPALTFFHYESKSRGYDSWSEEKQARFITEQKAMIERWGKVFRSDPYYPEAFLRRGKAFRLLKG